MVSKPPLWRVVGRYCLLGLYLACAGCMGGGVDTRSARQSSTVAVFSENLRIEESWKQAGQSIVFTDLVLEAREHVDRQCVLTVKLSVRRADGRPEEVERTLRVELRSGFGHVLNAQFPVTQDSQVVAVSPFALGSCGPRQL